MFLSLENKINKIDFNKSFFPKMGNKSLLSFYNSLIKNIKLKDILSKKETEYILYIPSTPRYFISASKKKLNRSSIKKIYFNTIEDLNKRYYVLVVENNRWRNVFINENDFIIAIIKYQF